MTEKTEIMNAELVAEMLEALRMSGLFCAEAKICFANAGGQIYRVSYDVVDGVTGQKMDDLSYEGWLHRIEDAIDVANARFRFDLDRVISVSVRFKCRPTSTSTYEVECTDASRPYWDRFRLEKTDDESGFVYSGRVDREDSMKMYRIDQVLNVMSRYYRHHRLDRVN